ncbi:MAG: hypothetical protein ACLFUC_05015 [Bacteroidales bacterium]
MKDKLEKYVEQNRDKFQVFDPDPSLWDNIDKNLKKKKKSVNLYYLITRAAAVVFIFSLSFMVSEYMHQRKDEKIKIAKTEINIPELKEAEYYYSSLLQQKMEEISPMLLKDPELKKDINMEINELDSIYNELKKDLHDNIANQEIVEAMIQNYRLKLEILEEILAELKDTNNIQKDETKYNHI